MASAEHNEHETYRVIVLDPTGAQVLLAPNRQRHVLPRIDIPRWQRVAENLTIRFEREWGEEVVVLFELPATNEGPRNVAAEHLCTRLDSNVPRCWVPVSALSKDSLVEGCDYAAIEHVVGICERKMAAKPAGPFSRLGWFCDLRNWMNSVIEPMGFHLTGRFRQLNASPTFSLVRFETDGPGVWFKAVGEPNLREFAITHMLAQLCPDYLPPILATCPEWNAWLSREPQGELLSEVPEQPRWERTAAALAKLQIESIDRCSAVLGAGARDLGSRSLSKLIQPVLSVAAQLMERQPEVPPPVLGRNDLLTLADSLQSALDRAKSTGVPETIGHLDLNPGNILVAENRCAFLDWAEAYVGNPLFSLEYLLEHAKRTFGTDSAVPAKLTEVYCRQWDGVISSAAMKQALALAPLLAVFAYAVGSRTWNATEKIEESSSAGYLRSLVRRMHRESIELTQHRVPVS